MPTVRDAGWRREARLARWLAWASLAWMCAEGAIGLWQGLAAGSIALTGIALAAAAVAVMPLLGRAKHKLAARLGSAAAAGEGTQNYLCAAQAVAVLAGLAVTAAWPGGWWIDRSSAWASQPSLCEKAPDPGTARTAADRAGVHRRARAAGRSARRGTGR